MRWCAGSEPARGATTRFWCTCNNAGRLDGQPCPVWVKEIVTTPSPSVILPRVIRTWVGQLGADDPLPGLLLAAVLDALDDPLAVAVGVVEVLAVAFAAAPEPDAIDAPAACWELAAITNPAASRAADPVTLGRHDMGFGLVI